MAAPLLGCHGVGGTAPQRRVAPRRDAIRADRGNAQSAVDLGRVPSLGAVFGPCGARPLCAPFPPRGPDPPRLRHGPARRSLDEVSPEDVVSDAEVIVASADPVPLDGGEHLEGLGHLEKTGDVATGGVRGG